MARQTIRFLRPPPIEVFDGPRSALIEPLYVHESGEYGHIAAFTEIPESHTHFVYSDIFGSRSKLEAAWSVAVNVPVEDPASWILAALLRQRLAEPVAGGVCS